MTRTMEIEEGSKGVEANQKEASCSNIKRQKMTLTMHRKMDQETEHQTETGAQRKKKTITSFLLCTLAHTHSDA